MFAPASKSAMQRAVAMSLLSDNEKLRLINPSYCSDALAVLKIAENLGAKVEKKANQVIISLQKETLNRTINCGESGLAVRMFSPILALRGGGFFVTGEGSLLQRPVSSIADALEKFSVSCETQAGFLPLKISGKLNGGQAEIDGSLSSQVLTGLLIALAVAEEDSILQVKNLQSKPYIDLTISMMQDFGVAVENFNYELFKIKGRQKYHAKDYIIEGDWSGAAFLLVAGLIAGKCELKNLNINSLQADREIISAIKLAGGKITVSENLITTEQSQLTAFEFDASDCPDLFPPLVSMASYCNGVSKIKGISRLKHKESNRALVLQTEFAKIGVKIDLKDDCMYVTGGQPCGGKADSNNDHRIAMALAVAALAAQSEVEIANAESVNKSYPDFYNDLIMST